VVVAWYSGSNSLESYGSTPAPPNIVDLRFESGHFWI
jgi:hypothetical protein